MIIGITIASVIIGLPMVILIGIQWFKSVQRANEERMKHHYKISREQREEQDRRAAEFEAEYEALQKEIIMEQNIRAFKQNNKRLIDINREKHDNKDRRIG